MKAMKLFGTRRCSSEQPNDIPHSCPQVTRVLLAAATALVTSCATVDPQPYWIAKNEDQASCLATEIEEGCGTKTPELWRLRIGDGFKLHFVEFDDQGWLYEKAQDEKAQSQIDWIIEDLTKSATVAGKQLRLVIYVHGWKHNAEPRDPDVRKFRHMLAQLRGVDVASGLAQKRELVGIYVGWRGKSWEKSTALHRFLLNTTFWTRKSAAIRVAQGQPRELFARLRAFQADANSQEKGGCPRDGSGRLVCKVRTAIIGHSFGGWIVQAAMSESMIDLLSEERDTKLQAPQRAIDASDKDKLKSERWARLADTILLINPAYEASRYEAVHRAARALAPESYHPPLLVSITSDKDVATGKAFPAGRALNGLFEKKTSDEQALAIRNTPGHLSRYHTHELSYSPADGPSCDGWRELYVFEEARPKDNELQLRLKDEYANDASLLETQIRANLAAEGKLQQTFFNEHGGLSRPSFKEGWVRPFCGGMRLRQLNEKENENKHPNTPVWNIRTSAPIILNHNDFMTPLFIDFIRQLYRDGELLQ